MKKYLFLILLLVLVGCQAQVQSHPATSDKKSEINPVVPTNQPVQTAKEVVQLNCQVASDCPIPMEYAIRSNCPFSSMCENNSCVVVCPVWQYVTNSVNKVSYQVACQKPEDCDCQAWDKENKYRCTCLDKQCVSVVESK